MTECHFYMANNFANMESMKRLRIRSSRYLEEDAERQFLEEAEEMMELLHFELERPTKLSFIKAAKDFSSMTGRGRLLEEGKFVEAVRLLESIVEKNAEFLGGA